MRHLGLSPVCEEADEGFEIYDEEQEASTQLLQRAGESSYAADVKAFLVDKYAALEYERFVERTLIQDEIKGELVEPLMDKVKQEIYRRLAKNPDEQRSLEKTIGTVFEVHRDIETTWKEHGELSRSINPVQPVKRDLIDRPDEDGQPTGPRRDDVVYDVPVQLELEAMLTSDPALRDRLQRASDSWAKERPEPGASRVVYTDFSHGAVMQNHPKLGTRADRSDGRHACPHCA